MFYTMVHLYSFCFQLEDFLANDFDIVNCIQIFYQPFDDSAAMELPV